MELTTSKKIKSYLERVYGKCRHCPDSLAFAANQACIDFSHDKAFDLFKLLTENQPIPTLHTHSYSFHTATGRQIIQSMRNYYFEAE